MRLFRHRRRPLLIVVSAFAWLVAGCGGDGATGDAGGGWTYSSQVEVKSFRGATDSRVLPHSVPAGEVELLLRLELAIDRGAAIVRLSDPSGAERWVGRLEGPAEELFEESFPAIEGDWTLRLELNGATGSYDLRLVSR